MLIHNMRNKGSMLIAPINRAQACLYSTHNCTSDAWASAGAVQLQAQCAAGAPRVPHPGVPGQVLLPPHGHHEQACLRCHTDPLPPQACPGLRLLPPPGLLLHLAHYQFMPDLLLQYMCTSCVTCDTKLDCWHPLLSHGCRWLVV